MSVTTPPTTPVPLRKRPRGLPATRSPDYAPISTTHVTKTSLFTYSSHSSLSPPSPDSSESGVQLPEPSNTPTPVSPKTPTKVGNITPPAQIRATTPSPTASPPRGLRRIRGSISETKRPVIDGLDGMGAEEGGEEVLLEVGRRASLHHPKSLRSSPKSAYLQEERRRSVGGGVILGELLAEVARGSEAVREVGVRKGENEEDGRGDGVETPRSGALSPDLSIAGGVVLGLEDTLKAEEGREEKEREKARAEIRKQMETMQATEERAPERRTTLAEPNTARKRSLPEQRRKLVPKAPKARPETARKLTPPKPTPATPVVAAVIADTPPTDADAVPPLRRVMDQPVLRTKSYRISRAHTLPTTAAESTTETNPFTTTTTTTTTTTSPTSPTQKQAIVIYEPPQTSSNLRVPALALIPATPAVEKDDPTNKFQPLLTRKATDNPAPKPVDTQPTVPEDEAVEHTTPPHPQRPSIATLPEPVRQSKLHPWWRPHDDDMRRTQRMPASVGAKGKGKGKGVKIGGRRLVIEFVGVKGLWGAMQGKKEAEGKKKGEEEREEKRLKTT